VFTAVDSPDEETLALAAGSDGYLVKGTDALNLPARILAIQSAAA
jgi:DNA-binding response OmpR family regulator